MKTSLLAAALISVAGPALTQICGLPSKRRSVLSPLFISATCRPCAKQEE